MFNAIWCGLVVCGGLRRAANVRVVDIGRILDHCLNLLSMTNDMKKV